MNTDNAPELILEGFSGLRISHPEHTSAPRTRPHMPGLVKRIPNIHRDDIHGMIAMDNVIVTGSKDTSVRLWTDVGEPVGVVLEHPQTTESHYSYKHWITALHGFPDGSVMIGSRNGYVTCKNIHSNRMSYGGILANKLPYAPDQTCHVRQNNKTSGPQTGQYRGAVYKVRNEPRITSITCQSGDGRKALIGMPEQFVQFDLDTNQVSRLFNLTTPDWIYGFAELPLQTIAIIHACCLSVFKECDDRPPQNGWEHVATVVREGKKVKGQRPFIADVNPFKDNSSWLALALFGGMTRVIDMERDGQIIHQGDEHQERVWKTVPVDSHTLLSCADDGLIKLWDIRQRKSARTYGGHPGRVSALALLNNGLFAAASCPSNPHDDPDKGQLFLYDRRG